MLLSLFLCFFGMYLIAGMGVSLFYHRILSHRILILKPWVETLFVFLALPAGTPVQWVGTHRKHHAFTDREGDPHSPVISGFWFAHCGWYIGSKNPFFCLIYALGGPARMLFDAFRRPRTNQENNHLANDISQIPLCAFVSKPSVYTPLLCLYLGILSVIFLSVFSPVYALLYLWLCLIIIYNLGDSLNSLGHQKTAKSKENSYAVNKPLLALATFGEGFHGEHHLHPTNQSMSTYPLGLSKLILFLLKFLCLTKE